MRGKERFSAGKVSRTSYKAPAPWHKISAVGEEQVSPARKRRERSSCLSERHRCEAQLSNTAPYSRRSDEFRTAAQTLYRHHNVTGKGIEWTTNGFFSCRLSL